MRKVFVATLIIIVSIIGISYKIENNDLLRVDIYYPQLNSNAEVNPNGSYINFLIKVDLEGYAALPYIGRKHIAGLEISEVEDMLQKAISKFLPKSIVAVSLERPGPQYVFIQGAVNLTINLSNVPKNLRKLVYILGMATSNKTVILKNIKIIRHSKIENVNVSKFYETGDPKYNPDISPGDVIYLPTPKTVGIFGMVKKPGIYQMNTDTTLLQLLSQAGVDLDFKKIKTIKIYRGNSCITLHKYDEEIFTQKLEDNDVVYIEPYKVISIYIMGAISKNINIYESEKPDLRKLLSLAGFNISNGTRWQITIIRVDEKLKYNVSKLEDIPNIPLKDGDIVMLTNVEPVKVYVNVYNSSKGGLVIFDNMESPDLKTLLYKLNINDNNLGIFVTRKEKTYYIKVENVLFNKENFNLKNFDYIYITPFAYGKITVTGIVNGAFGLLEKEENLKDFLLRTQILRDLTTVEKVVVIRNNQIFSFKVKDILSNNARFNIRDNDVIRLIPIISKVVYVRGDLNTAVYFSKDEPINKQTLLSKLNIKEDQVLELSGQFEDKGIVNIRLKNPINVFLYSEVLKSGEYNFDWNEPKTLKHLFAKAGISKLLEDEKLVIEVYRDDKMVYSKTILAKDLPNLDFTLQNNDFVKIYYDQIKITVLGSVPKQGIYYLPKGSTLRDLILKIGGISANRSSLQLIRNGTVKNYNIKLHSLPKDALQDNDTIIFRESDDQFVYVLGDVDTPGPVYTAGEPTNLLKILSLSGGLRNWGVKRSVRILTPDGKEKVYDMNFEILSKIVLKGGEIVYVIPSFFNRVYVLGAVARPSVVYMDDETTLLDVIMRAGGFSKMAVKSKVYVFRGGTDGPVEVYDMSWIDKKAIGKNPKLKPGDIVFVPDNPIVSITDMISIINGMISFVNNSINLYKNVNSIMGQ